jgi:hypothetical protein
MRFFSKHRVLATLTGVFVAFTLGIAGAAWISETWQNAPGRVKTGAPVAFVGTSQLCATGATDALPTLNPGETKAMCFTLNNTAGTPVTIQTATPVAGSQTITGQDGTCNIVANTTLNAAAGLSIVVPPGNDIYTIPGLITMSASAPVGCANGYVAADFNLST